MRLIDADKFIANLKDYTDKPMMAGLCATLVGLAPTAYDIDKVVEELEEWSFEAKILVPNNNELGEYEEEVKRKIICTQNAIEIVKQGGLSDDVCEWKSASDGEFIQNPHTKRLYSNEPSMQNVYCNTCGKKIKVVE